MNLNKLFYRIYIILNTLFTILTNISFIIAIIFNAFNTNWDSYNIFIYLFICILNIFYIFLCSYICLLEFFPKLYKLFKKIKINISTENLRFFLGLIQLIISCYYIQYEINYNNKNINISNIIKYTFLTFSIIYFIFSLLNIIFGVINIFPIKISLNRESMFIYKNNESDNDVTVV